ncbi:uncharacterized protein MELLADRAFT_124548 [Melampsora larici-populina 98AG31]|uniref:Secreted protein n=1 Tax=Melampsora larici-populina (strain 98AG31 / pathotype 3-4-7) TaxID=747676 RepID=F4RCX3_MELLP|nr:uncharacterized protein MELLADRAFT_124548 [Melampsora larici-populina 98AG31]EGG09800.1 hypothetical protein MELLADRAFT_124548 [Melampsora larici-populina 98AG31]
MLTLTVKSILHHTFLFISTYLLISQSQSIQAQVTSQQITEVRYEYDSFKLSAGYPDGFGIPLKPQAILNVFYPNGNINLGQLYNKSDVSTKPTISVTPIAAAVEGFKAPNAFTLIMSDANALGYPDPQGGFRHFLDNGVTFGDPSPTSTLTVNEASGTLITSYVGPAPPLNSGEHRYAWLLFAQPAGFQAPANLSSVNSGPGYWDLKSYVTTTGLGDLVAASFFTVQNGSATVASATATTTINTSTGLSSPANVAAITATDSPDPNCNTTSFAIAQHVNLVTLIKSLVFTVGIACISFSLVQ